MIGGFTYLLGAPAGAKIGSMHREAAHQRRLRKTLNVSGARRTFQPVQKHDLSFRSNVWLVLDNYNTRCRIDAILLRCTWKLPFVDPSRPKIACNCEQVRISEMRVKFWLQT